MEGDGRIGNKRARDEKEASNGGERRLEKRAIGVVVLEEYSYSGDEMINGVKYEEEKETLSPSPSPATAGTTLFNQLITNLVASPPEDLVSDQPNGESDKGQVAVEDDKDDIVDRLPRTLSEVTAPETDEASILIHSIIHD